MELAIREDLPAGPSTWEWLTSVNSDWTYERGLINEVGSWFDPPSPGEVAIAQ